MKSHAMPGSWWLVLYISHSVCSGWGKLTMGTIYPATKSLYYLHTTGATWNSARDTCARYGARLVHLEETEKLLADFTVLDDYMGWHETFFGKINSRLWTGLHYNTVDQTLSWDDCKRFDQEKTEIDLQSASTSITSDGKNCGAMDPNELRFYPESCDNHLPYICQIDQGECWFLPLDNVSFIADPIVISPVATAKECAQSCRERQVESDGSECWGFTFRDVCNGTCDLHMSKKRHNPLKDISSSVQPSQHTSYFKICTGGSVTDMEPVASGIRGHQSCVGAGIPYNGWISGVCFCQCDLPPAVLSPSELILTLDEQVEEIVKQLSVNPTNLSAAYRKLNSAEDTRTSATSIGTVGIAFMSVLLGCMLIFDLRVLFTHLRACLTRKPQNLMTATLMAKTN